MADGPTRRRRLLKLWEENPNCCWCGRPTFLVFRSPQHVNGANKVPIPLRGDEATIEHLRSRFHPGRTEPPNGEQRWTIACWECNNRRCADEQAQVPKAELQRRSQQHSAKRQRKAMMRKQYGLHTGNWQCQIAAEQESDHA